MTTKTVTSEQNPTTGRMEFALRLDGVHMGYADSYLKAERLADEIAEKRKAMALEIAVAVQSAAYIAPRPTPRKAKVKKLRQPACDCPQCVTNFPHIPSNIYYCSAGREWLGYYAGLFIVADHSRLFVEASLNNHRYSLLCHGHDLDAEQAADVLEALDATTI